MKKIPTIFERDWDNNPGLVLDKPNPDAQWVFDGEGQATVKVDGTCCLVKDGKLYKRQEFKSLVEAQNGGKVPEDAIMCQYDVATDSAFMFVPVGWGPEDKRHVAAFFPECHPDGTYELCGPKIQGNREGYNVPTLVRHGSTHAAHVPRTFDGLKAYFANGGNTMNIEGIVWHHPDGRMAKIKLRDFGLKRGERAA